MKKAVAKTKSKSKTAFDKRYDANRYRSFIPPVPADYESEYEEDEVKSARIRDNATPAVISAPSINNVKVSTPRTFKEIQELVLSLTRKEAVIVDISKIAPDKTRRVLDYLSGAVFALGGSEKCINSNIYMFTPKVSAEYLSRLTEN